VKPSNAVIPDTGEVKIKLLDFGLAKFIGSGPGTVSNVPRVHPRTRSGAILGTLLYMAPECRRGEAATARSDVFSLGAVLYDLYTGASPSTERPTRELVASDPSLGRIIDRCLRENAAERYGSAVEVRAALARLESKPDYPATENPYRGLRPFDEEHHALFFGREAETEEVIQRLRDERFVLVAGDSGVGKSSLCQARIARRVLDGAIEPQGRASVLRLVPGRHPVRALADALAPMRGGDAEELAAWLRSDPAALARAIPSIRGLGLVVLFIDQMEELLTVADRKEAEAFGAALLALHRERAVPARILGTVRGDFFTRLAAVPGLGELVPRALFVLRPMRRDQLRATVTEPARVAGVDFETSQTVDELVAEAEKAPGALPLLQFTMAELWEARDRSAQKIPAAALARVGGVSGALARHADDVIAPLFPDQRAAARRVLLRLVTAQCTRARAAEGQLVGSDPAAKTALDALVAGRLVVAHQAEGGSTEYELAHEALLTGWETLRGWIDADGDRRQIRARIAAAAAEWERLGTRKDALWDRRRLHEASRVDPAELDVSQRAFLGASARRVARTRRNRYLLLAAGPVIAMAVIGAARWRTLAELDARAGERFAGAVEKLAEARRADDGASRAREKALALYSRSKTAKDWEGAQKAWAKVVDERASADAAYEAAGLRFESALAIDPLHARARSGAAGALSSRANLARRFGEHHGASMFEQRLAADPDRSEATSGRARLNIDVEPRGTAVSIAAFATISGRARLLESKSLGKSPTEARELPPGSYLLTFGNGTAPGVRLPILLDAGETVAVRFAVPRTIPDGYVFVPPGRFLTGFGEDEKLRRSQGTPPSHEATTGAYLIARHEVTFAEYVAFLETLNGKDLATRLPHSKVNTGSVELRRGASGWELVLQPTIHAFRARWGEPIRYPKREVRAAQDWRKFPVTAISLRDAEAYVRWLAKGRLPGAHLCDDYEWERAARGADGRSYTTGETLAASEVNIDETYGRDPWSFGPDEVGSHPESDSVFGVQDMVGNVMEMVASIEGFGPASIRGGSWYYDDWSARLPARFPLDETTRSGTVGFRVCASVTDR